MLKYCSVFCLVFCKRTGFPKTLGAAKKDHQNFEALNLSEKQIGSYKKIPINSHKGD